MINFYHIGELARRQNHLFIKHVDIDQVLFKGLYDRQPFRCSSKPILLRSICQNKDSAFITLSITSHLINPDPRGDRIFSTHYFALRLVTDPNFDANTFIARKHADFVNSKYYK